jgi:hypothetical protein
LISSKTASFPLLLCLKRRPPHSEEGGSGIALPTEKKVEGGTSHSKSGTSVNSGKSDFLRLLKRPSSPQYTLFHYPPPAFHKSLSLCGSLWALFLAFYQSIWYRGTSLTKKRTPLRPYRRPMPGVLWGSLGGGRSLMGEVTLYLRTVPLSAPPDFPFPKQTPVSTGIPRL